MLQIAPIPRIQELEYQKLVHASQGLLFFDKSGQIGLGTLHFTIMVFISKRIVGSCYKWVSHKMN